MRFEIGGLWGGGNTLTERHLLATGENTIYNSFDGEGVLGPRTGEALERVAVIGATLSLGTFLERYGDLPEADCRIWHGEELLGIDCDTACAAHAAACDDDDTAARECAAACARSPRAVSDCLARASTCEVRRCVRDEGLSTELP